MLTEFKIISCWEYAYCVYYLEKEDKTVMDRYTIKPTLIWFQLETYLHRATMEWNYMENFGQYDNFFNSIFNKDKWQTETKPQDIDSSTQSNA